MRMFRVSLRLSAAILAIVALAATAVVFAVTREHELACPPGYSAPESDGGHEADADAGAAGCVALKHPERVDDLMKVNTQLARRYETPGGTRAGAHAAAVRTAQARAAEPRTFAGNGGTWTPAGHGPLIADNAAYGQVNGEGLADLSGRVNDFAYDARHGRLYAAVGEGGVWESADLGKTWRSIADQLPSQAIGSVAYSPAQGGTVIVTTGDDVYGGGGTFAGLGVWRTTDDGAHWTHAAGVPSDTNSYKVAVDPTKPSVVYAATGAGLFRSTDDGATFSNVDLPVGDAVPGNNATDCTGAPPTKEPCYLANMVTDVVVQAPGGTGHVGGSKVLAAVGWRAGTKTNKSHSYPSYEEAPGDGLYESDDGVHFHKAGVPGVDQTKLGRIELGAATGPKQDHNYVYAIIQDTTAFQGGNEASGIDIPGSSAAPATNTYLLGVFVSPDFGTTWRKLTDATQLESPSTGSALTGTACQAQMYCPGIQAWYNDWIKPDPTQADSNGVPTRLVFGLEELWENQVAGQAQDGTTPDPFHTIGPYFAGDTCLFLNAGLPQCPTSNTSQGQTTTHPDQHGGLFVPSADGRRVTLVAGNDGGSYTQTIPTASGSDFDSKHWGRGANHGYNTLLPYDAQVAKDGTIWSGLQDNGEMRIDPQGREYETYGGDGGFDAVDPDHSDVAYEGLDGGTINVTTDGGKTWTNVTPPSDNYQFTNPFVMDPANPAHMMTAGTQVWEATDGPTAPGSSQTPTWTSVFTLPTPPSGATPQMSAIDVRGTPNGQALPAGPATANFSYTGGSGTVPGGQNLDTTGTNPTFPPGTYEDHPFTIGAGDGDASATIKVSWADSTNDWDVYVYRKDAQGNLTEVGSSAGSTDPETVVLDNPAAGDYVIRVVNFTATGTYNAAVTFAQRPGGAQAVTDAAYVGFCGYCDALNTRPFKNGIATNVGGSKPPKAGSPDGWHVAAAAGLPNRYITSVQIDPADPRTVYVTLGGYSRRWLPVGALHEDTPNVGTGHVFKSTDAGATFTDISGDLPDTPADWTVVRNGQLVVGTDIGVFLANDTNGGHYETLGSGLPAAPVFTMELKPKATPSEPDKLVIATQGRGVYTYTFNGSSASTKNSSAVACAAIAGFRSVGARARSHGRRVAIRFSRRVRHRATVDVFQVSHGRTLVHARLIARFRGRARGFTWNGRSNRHRHVTDGYYFIRYAVSIGFRRNDVRRVTLLRSHGRWHVKPTFFRREGCDVVHRFKLSNPAFGGRFNRPLGIAFELTRSARASVVVRRGHRVIKRFRTRRYLGGRFSRVLLPSRHLRRGDYRVTLTVGRTRATLLSHRL